MNIQPLHNFHQTKPGYIVFGLVELGLAILFGSLAIDSGHLWQWAFVALFLLGVARNAAALAQLLKKDLLRR